MNADLDKVDRALDEAIEHINLAYAADADMTPGVVVDYICVYAVRSFDDDGDPTTAYGISWPSDNRTSHYAALGLIEYARENIKRRLFGDGSDD